MVTKQTVAIIGAAGKMGSAISRKLAGGNYRVLLFDIDPSVIQVAEAIISKTPGADVEVIQCSAEACWESDLIVFAVPENAEQSIAEHIVEYSNQKIIVSISGTNDRLEKLLPNAKIVKTLNTINVNDVDVSQKQVAIYCNDEDVYELVAAMVETIGFTPVKEFVS